MSNVPSAVPVSYDVPLMEALSALQRLNASLNHLGADQAARSASMRLIVAGAVQLVPGTSARITLVDNSARASDPASPRSADLPHLVVHDRELDILTGRERQVLSLLAEGMTNKQIAAALVITPNTVKRHLKAIFEKLGIRTRSAAAAKAISARFPAH